MPLSRSTSTPTGTRALSSYVRSGDHEIARAGASTLARSGKPRSRRLRESLGPWPLLTLLTILVPASAPTPVPAQVTDYSELDGKVVAEVEIRGARSIPVEDLLDGIETRDAGCESFLFALFCLVSDSDLFEDRPLFRENDVLQDELRIQVIYWRRGYRQVDATSEAILDGDEVRVVFTVEEGPPTVVESVRVDQSRTVLDSAAVRDAELPAEGSPLDVQRLDSAVIRLRNALGQAGYRDGSLTRTIDFLDSLRVAVTIRVEPGRRTTLDEVVVQGNQKISDRTIRRYLDLETGTVLGIDDIHDARRNLYGSNLFRQVLVEVPPQPDSAKRVVATVREAPLRAFEGGIGINTVDFVQLEGGFTRFDFFGGGRRLDLRTGVGNLFASQLFDRSIFDAAVPEGVASDVRDAFLDPTFRASLEFSQPWFLSVENSLGASLFAHRRSVPGIVIDRGHGASLSLGRRLARGLRADVGYRYERNDVDAGELYFCVNFGVCRDPVISALQETQSLSPLTLGLTFDRTDAPLFPSEGVRARVEGEYADEVTLSDYRYLRLRGEAAAYFSLGPGVLSVRGRAGWVDPGDGTNASLGLPGVGPEILHPRKRFYAGGSRSVRGYGENLLGPRLLTVDPDDLVDPDDPGSCTRQEVEAATCDPAFLPSNDFEALPVGGDQLLEGTVEYRFPVTTKFWGVVFVDAGRVGDREIELPTTARSDLTPGIGARYMSPAGPIRVDLGFRPSISQELSVITEVRGPDGEGRIVRLQTPKRFEPGDDADGFFQTALRRLQLHISLGETF